MGIANGHTIPNYIPTQKTKGIQDPRELYKLTRVSFFSFGNLPNAKIHALNINQADEQNINPDS